LNPYIVAFHSQTNEYPSCMEGMTELWKGYSFMFIDAGADSKFNQQLGDAGSCMENFFPGFYGMCDGMECKAGNEDHKTVWLATAMFGAEGPTRKLTMKRREVELKNHISRCVVCDTIFKLQTVHSYTSKVPECPDRYVPVASPNRDIAAQNAQHLQDPNLWIGFSFWEVSVDNYAIGIQTEQPASCLLYYEPLLMASCDVEGCRLESDSSHAFWIQDTARIAKEKADNNGVLQNDMPPFQETKEYVSRCVVCRRPEAGQFRFD